MLKRKRMWFLCFLRHFKPFFVEGLGNFTVLHGHLKLSESNPYICTPTKGEMFKIARMLTVKREREIEEGVGNRLSRKLDRQWKRSIVVRPPPSLKKLQEEEAAAEAEKSA
ncbi:hypothetical protein POTOM_020819 [Populus tomentosa]|uniref:Uncharacterized protein n=1 Tax=Populus tomentosa TaxID=118781 RepID=A0A8X7ZPD7_POPTO|nr:hypothetical protein POTOM_020819 [Populus tomentosa]